MLLDGDHEFVFFLAVLSGGEAFHFEFVKLVDAEDALHVFAVGAGFAAERGGVAEEAEGKIFFVEDFATVHGAEDVFGGALEPEFVTFDLVALVAGFEAVHGVEEVGFDHVGREDRDEGARGDAF